MKIILSLALIYLCTVHAKKLQPENVIIAINSGSFQQTKGEQGFIYQSDQGYSESRSVDYSKNEEKANTNILYSYDQAVYKTERHNDITFGYELELIQDATYVLILKFCEMYFQFPNERVFNIKIGDKQVVKNVDIVQQVGPEAAYDEYIQFELRNNQIYHKTLGLCENAYNPSTQKLRIEIEKGAKDLPIINGLVLYKGTLEDTDYSELEQIRIDWKAALEEQKRSELEEKRKKYEAKKILLKNVKEDEFLEIKDENRIAGIIRVLTNKSGIAIIGTLIFISILIMFFGKDPKDKEN